MLVGMNHFFVTLQLRNITITFLPPDVTCVVQPLDRGSIASFKICCKKKLVEWILSQFDSSTAHHNLRKVASNVRHAIVWCSQAWRQMNPQIIWNNWRISKILPTNWSADFAMDNEHEKSRVKEATYALVSLISYLNLGIVEYLIEEYVQLA